MKTPDELATEASSALSFDLHDAIRRRAEEIYFETGRIPGRDLQNWAQAEREVQTRRRTAIVVKVSGVQYVGEYGSEYSDGYTPGEFAPGEPVPVVIEGDQMLVRRPNGRVLETRIVKTVG